MMSSHASTLRWSACFGLALCFHAAGAAALLARWNETTELGANAPVITIELGPVAASPNITPNDSPDAQLSKLAEPEPQPEAPLEKIEVPAAAQAEVQITPPPKEKPKDKKPKQKQASLNSAPAAAEQRAERAAAPIPGARNSDSLPNWKSQLVAQIERHKHYEGSDQGVARVAFSVDRSGRVHGARVVTSSGSSTLDRDAIAWLERSQPLPPPPPEIAGAMIPIIVPLRYNQR